MKTQLLLISFLFFFSFDIVAQVKTKEKEKYTQKEQKLFVKIYKHTLDFPFDIIASMQKNAPKINIKEERFSEILQAQFAGNEPNLSEPEIKEMTKLKALMESEKEEYDEEFKKYVTTQGLPFNKYQEMEKRYHDDTKFQSKVNKLSKAK
jgi:hypothetical protein